MASKQPETHTYCTQGNLYLHWPTGDHVSQGGGGVEEEDSCSSHNILHYNQ